LPTFEHHSSDEDEGKEEEGTLGADLTDGNQVDFEAGFFSNETPDMLPQAISKPGSFISNFSRQNQEAVPDHDQFNLGSFQGSTVQPDED